jgi:ligand-binding sensor domain-containing protein
MAVMPDRNRGVWCSVEEGGLYYCPSGGQTWRHVTHADGLGDDTCHAMVCDAAGRCWFGTQSHGVSIYNGKVWRTYGLADGPLGCHVYAMAVSPSDGSVWIGTEMGVTRWNPATDAWRTYTRSDGLPGDDVTAVAVDRGGQVYVGTGASGLAVASPREGYDAWRVPARWPAIPNVPGGTGLPSGQVNALFVASTGTVYVGTPFGLARSNDHGQSFRFLRGADWLDTLGGAAVERPEGFFDTKGHALAQDYVTTIGEGITAGSGSATGSRDPRRSIQGPAPGSTPGRERRQPQAS